MRSKLLSSFIFVTIFWWLVTTFAWSISSPETNLKSLQAVAHLMPFAHIEVPKGAVSVLDAYSMQKRVFLYWTLPIWTAIGFFAMIGLGVVWYKAYLEKKERDDRESPVGNFRGITISLGPIPQPKTMKKEALEIGASNSDVLDSLTEKEKTVLFDVLGILAAHPESYAGEGHAIPLLEMAMGAVETALSHKTRPGLAAIVAAASELGKITAYKKEATGGWLKTKDVCRESTTTLATLGSWWALPVEDRMAVMFAVRYRDTPDTLIDASGNRSVLSLSRSLLYKAAAAVEKASTDERERVLAKQEVPDLALKVFLDNLNQLGFQDGLPKGVKAIGWKIGGRVYLLEIMLRETLMAKLPEDVRGALAATASGKRGLHPFTIDLMKALNAKGWLVKEVNGTKVTAREALWNIQAGKLPYKGVLILDIPDEHREMLPAKDSIYAVTVTGPWFSSASSAPMTTKDMAGLGLFSSGDKNSPLRKPGTESSGDAKPSAPVAAAATAVQGEGASPSAASTKPVVSAQSAVPAAAARPTPSAPRPQAAAPTRAQPSVARPATATTSPTGAGKPPPVKGKVVQDEEAEESPFD